MSRVPPTRAAERRNPKPPSLPERRALKQKVAVGALLSRAVSMRTSFMRRAPKRTRIA